MTDRDKALWQAIRRGLMLMVAAIDRYLAQEQPTEPKR